MRNGELTLRYLLQPIEQELADPTVTEIVCQKPGEIGIERGDGWTWREVPDLTFNVLDAIGILAAGQLSKRFDRANPICMTTLPDGQRCTLIGPPCTPPGTLSITIRIPSKSVHTVHDPAFAEMMQAADNHQSRRHPWDKKLIELHRRKDWPAFFSLAVKSHKTIAATGSTGSGKTFQLRRFMREIPSEERVITVEDTDEYGPLPLRNRVSLFYGSANVTAEDAIAATLRMRPDRVAMQELRGAEAFAYVRLLAAGHPGGLTTWHAEEGDPFTPLALMAKQHDAGKNIPDDKLLTILRNFIDIVVFCRRDIVDGKAKFSVPSVWFRAAEEQQRMAS